MKNNYVDMSTNELKGIIETIQTILIERFTSEKEKILDILNDFIDKYGDITITYKDNDCVIHEFCPDRFLDFILNEED